jgi:hypothetical protein
VVLLGESQRRGRRGNADAGRELAFTYQLEPVQPIPVKFLEVNYSLVYTWCYTVNVFIMSYCCFHI